MSDTIGPDGLCPNCGKPTATQADYDRTAEGEGEHLCWGEYGARCVPRDWRSDLAAERLAHAETRVERDRLRAALEAGPTRLREIAARGGAFGWSNPNHAYESAAVTVEVAQREFLKKVRGES